MCIRDRDLEFARKFAEAVHKVHPGKMLAYNCSPSFNWKKNLDDATIAKFQKELGAMGYKYQSVSYTHLDVYKRQAVTFGGITFNPGEYPYSDADGVLVSSKPLC